MSIYLTDGADLTSVAASIRSKGGTSGALSFPEGFVSAVGAIPVEPPRTNLLQVEGLTWYRGYLNSAGGVQTQNATNLEMTSGFVPVPENPSKHLMLSVELPAENASSIWGACFLYDANQNKVGARKVFSFVEGVTSGDRKLMSAMTDYSDSTVRYIRVSFRTFGSAKACLEIERAPKEAMDLVGLTIPVETA